GVQKGQRCGGAGGAAWRLAVLSPTLLVEEMITDGVAEVLIGMRVDPQFGLLLVLGAGGVLTELLHDSVTLLPPFAAAGITAALGRLQAAPLLAGFRGRPGADVPGVGEVALGCARYALQNLRRLAGGDPDPPPSRPQGSGA